MDGFLGRGLGIGQPQVGSEPPLGDRGVLQPQPQGSQLGFAGNSISQPTGIGSPDWTGSSPSPTNPGTPFHDMLSQLPQGSNIFDMLHTGGMGALSQMPPQLQQFLQSRLSPVDHNPWERGGSGMPSISLTNSSYQNNG